MVSPEFPHVFHAVTGWVNYINYGTKEAPLPAETPVPSKDLDGLDFVETKEGVPLDWHTDSFAYDDWPGSSFDFLRRDFLDEIGGVDEAAGYGGMLASSEDIFQRGYSESFFDCDWFDS